MKSLSTPPNWRKGQTIFNFLWWLQAKKGYTPEFGAGGRMADPFHIQDELFEALYEEFLSDPTISTL